MEVWKYGSMEVWKYGMICGAKVKNARISFLKGHKRKLRFLTSKLSHSHTWFNSGCQFLQRGRQISDRLFLPRGYKLLY